VNPYVFIVGCPRSGTTLLRRMVDAHPDIAVIDETHWITHLYERRRGVTADGLATPEILEHLRGDRRFARLELPWPAVERVLDGARDYAAFVSGVFDQYGALHGKRLVGDKTPGYIRKIPTLRRLWPNARFVHLIRDGRDVALSVAAWKKSDRLFAEYRGWPDDPWTTAALWWERSLRLGREAAAALPPGSYREMRYEALVSDPQGECRALCGFLGLEFDPAMLRFHEGRTRRHPRYTTKQQWLPPTGGLRDWRTQMPAEVLESFESAAGDLLDELGYPRGARPPAPSMRERANAARRVFCEDVLARQRPLPEGWA
jgi:hypothetical protein